MLVFLGLCIIFPSGYSASFELFFWGLLDFYKFRAFLGCGEGGDSSEGEVFFGLDFRA